MDKLINDYLSLKKKNDKNIKYYAYEECSIQLGEFFDSIKEFGDKLILYGNSICVTTKICNGKAKLADFVIELRPWDHDLYLIGYWETNKNEKIKFNYVFNPYFKKENNEDRGTCYVINRPCVSAIFLQLFDKKDEIIKDLKDKAVKDLSDRFDFETKLQDIHERIKNINTD